MKAMLVTPDFKDAAQMRDVCAAFEQGRLIAMPTETVYGLAAPINRPDLVDKIFELKGRPATNPLIVHVSSIQQARTCVSSWSFVAETLAMAFWPGPLTMVLPRSAIINDRITAGQQTVALRMPDHPMALALIEASGSPIVAPSANLSTRLSPTTAVDVAEVFDDDSVLVLDGGPCRVGIESSIISLDDATKTAWWLRPGQIDQDAIRNCLPADWKLASPHQAKQHEQRAPGDRLVHYRPTKPLRVTVVEGPRSLEQTKAALMENPESCLVDIGENPSAAARELYGALRRADAQPGRFIDVVIPAQWPMEVAWEGVLNRLRKSASSWRSAET